MAIQSTRPHTPTLDDFYALIARTENADRVFEFINREIVEVPSNTVSSYIAGRIQRRVAAFVENNDLGYVTGEAGGYTIWGSERYAPDVVFIRKDKGISSEWFHPLPPDLAVEVDYPSSAASQSRLREKLFFYPNARVTVWLVFPETRTIEVYIPGETILKFGAGDTLDGGAVLPGFAVAVEAVFGEI
ncbi:MAG: Uma2 family endonuclease [Chloroflexota bacterium]|nr:Uma2 family endonuclease [Chloroflexota bacterium]